MLRKWLTVFLEIIIAHDEKDVKERILEKSLKIQKNTIIILLTSAKQRKFGIIFVHLDEATSEKILLKSTFIKVFGARWPIAGIA